MVLVPIMTSAIQKAISQLCCLAMVLKGRPAIKAPTVTKNVFFLVTWKRPTSHTCFGRSCLSAVYHSPLVPQRRETFRRNLKVHSHWLSPQTRQLVHKRKTQRQHRGGGSRSERDKMKMQNSSLHFHHIQFLCPPKCPEFTSFSDTPIRTEMGCRSWTHRGASWVKTGSSFECFQYWKHMTVRHLPRQWQGLGITSGISGVMVTLKRYIDTYIPAIMRISRLWRGLPWVPRPCWRKRDVSKTDQMNSRYFRLNLSPAVTHTSYSSVREEACCQAAYETSHLQGTHVGTACKTMELMSAPMTGPAKRGSVRIRWMILMHYPWEQSGLFPAWGTAVPSQWQPSSPQTRPSTPGTAPTGKERGGTPSGCSHCCLVSASTEGRCVDVAESHQYLRRVSCVSGEAVMWTMGHVPIFTVIH